MMAVPGGRASGKRAGKRRLLNYLVLSLLLLLLGPILLGGVGSWLGARFGELFFRGTGSTEEEKLRDDIIRLMLENSVLREEALKAGQYRTLLGITRTDYREAVPARILYRSEGLVAGTMVADKGRRDGVSNNSVCISAEGLVGVVSSISETTCEILPITSPAVNVSCVTWPSGSYGILRSDPSGKLSLTHVDLASGVETGEQVLTSRYGGVFPDGILAGTVREVSEGQPGLALEIEVEPAVDFESTGEVLILLPEAAGAAP